MLVRFSKRPEQKIAKLVSLHLKEMQNFGRPFKSAKSVDFDFDFDKRPEKSLKVFECFSSFTN